MMVIGKRRGEGGQKVDRAGRIETVDQLVGERLDTRPQPLDLARDEGAVDQRSQPRVHRRFQLEHRIGFDAVECLEMAAILADAAAVGNAGRVLAAEAAVAQQPVDVVEAAKAPEAEFLPEEGIRDAVQEGIGLVRVQEESRLVRVEPQADGWLDQRRGRGASIWSCRTHSAACQPHSRPYVGARLTR